MKRLLHLVLLGSVMTATLGGCYVSDRPVGYVRAPRVWVPAHWHRGVWVGGHWRYA